MKKFTLAAILLLSISQTFEASAVGPMDVYSKMINNATTLNQGIKANESGLNATDNQMDHENEDNQYADQVLSKLISSPEEKLPKDPELELKKVARKRSSADSALAKGGLKDADIQIGEKTSTASFKKYNKMAYSAFTNGHLEVALKLYKQAMQADHSNPDAMFNIAALYQSMGRYYQAKKVFERIAKLRPDYVPAVYNQLFLVHNIPALQVYPEAARALNYDSDNPFLLCQMGILKLRMDNEADAGKYFIKALKESKNHPVILYNMAIAYDNAGKRQEAIASYNSTLHEYEFFKSGSDLESGELKDNATTVAFQEISNLISPEVIIERVKELKK